MIRLRPNLYRESTLQVEGTQHDLKRMRSDRPKFFVIPFGYRKPLGTYSLVVDAVVPQIGRYGSFPLSQPQFDLVVQR